MKNNQFWIVVVLVFLGAFGIMLLWQMRTDGQKMMDSDSQEMMIPEASPLDAMMMEDKESQDEVIDDEVEQIESQLKQLDDADFSSDNFEVEGL